MADFIDEQMPGSRFERVDLSGSEFRSADLTGTRFRWVELHRVVMQSVELFDVQIEGEIENLTINGVDIGPLVSAELDRRDPDRPLMRPTDPDGFRQAWQVIERRWAVTEQRAGRLAPELLHESVDGEWSFIQTLRHLAFATESWVSRAVLGVARPWHPLSLPWDQMPEIPGVPRDRAARPSLAEALQLRHDRMATVRRVIDDLTVESLAGHTGPIDGPGWPPEARSFPVFECLRIVLNEEWEHRRYAERDLAVLEARGS